MSAPSEYPRYSTEYALSSRGACKGCKRTFGVGDVRVGVWTRSTLFDGDIVAWYCLRAPGKCVRTHLRLNGARVADKIEGFASLFWFDQLRLLVLFREALPHAPLDEGEGPFPQDLHAAAVYQGLSARMRSKILWTLSTMLREDATLKDLKLVRAHNNLGEKGGETQLRTRVADALAFGLLPPCPKCKEGELVVHRGEEVKCSAWLDEWSRCDYTALVPAVTRQAVKIPPTLIQGRGANIFARLDEAIRSHVIGAMLWSAYGPMARDQSALVREQMEIMASEVSGPLAGLDFSSRGKLTRTRDALRSAIEGAGATYTTELIPGVTHLLTTPEYLFDPLNAENRKLCEDLKITPVREEFLDVCLDEGDEVDDFAYIIRSTHVTEHDKLGAHEHSGHRARSKKAPVYQPTDAERQRLFGNKKLREFPKRCKKAVDSGVPPKFRWRVHVVPITKGAVTDGEIYDVMLNMSDITSQRNSFYVLQLLTDDFVSNNYYVHIRWGRVGTDIEGTAFKSYAGIHEALAEFKERYKSKTENNWDQRANFEKKPKQYAPIQMAYDDDDDDDSDDDAAGGRDGGIPSKLPAEVQQVLNLIFDQKTMRATLERLKIDTSKMPLGKISQQQLMAGLAVLTEIEEALGKSPKPAESAFVSWSNKFYSLVPHSFGTDRVPIIDSLDTLGARMEVMKALLEVERSVAVLKQNRAAAGQQDQCELDRNFERLGIELTPLAAGAPDRGVVQAMVDAYNTSHAAGRGAIELVSAFSVVRPDEHKRYQPVRQQAGANRHLLLHGSRMTNMAGILAQGLRIAPPEAPHSGYMFGKGAYFGASVSKSIEYAFPDGNGLCMMLLVDVAMGSPLEVTEPTWVDDRVLQAKGKQSTIALGTVEPGDTKTAPDGARYFVGKEKRTKVLRSVVREAEYVVYNTNRCAIRGLALLRHTPL